MRQRLFFLLLVGVLLLSACNLPASSLPLTQTAESADRLSVARLTLTPEPLKAVTPASATASPIPLKGNFTLSILVDLDSEPVTREQAQTLVEEAGGIMTRLTGFNFEMVDFRETSGSVDSILQKYFADPNYVRSDGIIIFSYGDSGEAKLYGGYGFARRGPAGFVSRFKSPYVEDNSVYIGVIHFNHRFAVCGYDGNEKPVSAVSIGGECRNQPGTVCVEKYGYQMCSNLVNDLYASTPTYMASSTFVHEMMHSFGESGSMDHYFTPDCTEKMKTVVSKRPYQAEYFDSAEGDFYVNMCPYVFDVFVDSYQP
ncbi:MAG: hypothetical protein HXY38_03985 [Chloroflexi bacterium]|nr:hypothetical protein [Chloroflexota bacterium]